MVFGTTGSGIPWGNGDPQFRKVRYPGNGADNAGGREHRVYFPSLGKYIYVKMMWCHSRINGFEWDWNGVLGAATK